MTLPACIGVFLFGMGVLAMPGVGRAEACGADPWAMPHPPTRAHQVQRGETLTGIARRYGVTLKALTQANRLASPSVTLRTGTRLTIPPAPLARGRAASARRPASATPGATTMIRHPGDEALPLGPTFIWPVGGPVSSSFGRRRDGWHQGIDILAPRGTPIMAAADGVVVASGREPRYGQVVKIAHGGGFVTVYAHNHENLVDVGTWVTAGQSVATVGRTGRATREHLHFEIRYDSRPFNPIAILNGPAPVVVAHEPSPVDGPADD